MKHDRIEIIDAVYAPGSIVQVASAQSSNSVATTLTTWQTKPDPAPSITTKVANSKILVIVSTPCRAQATHIHLDIRREISGGVSTDNISGELNGCGYLGTDAGIHHTITYQYQDEPAQVKGTTITYKINYKAETALEVNVGLPDTLSTITLMEIAP